MRSLASWLLVVSLLAIVPTGGAAAPQAQGVASGWSETLTINDANAHPAKSFEAFDSASLNLYDFNGDGQMEIVSNNDNNRFYVLDSKTGGVLFEGPTSHPGGETWPVRDINPIAIGNLMGDGRPCMVVPSDAAKITAWCYDAAASTPTAFNFTKEWDVSIDAALYEPNFKQNHPWMYYPGNGTLMKQYEVGSDGDAFMASVDGTGCKYVFVETDGYPGQLAFDCHGAYKWSVSWFDGNAGAVVVDINHDGKKEACFASDAGELACYDAKSGSMKWVFRSREHGAYPGSIPLAPTFADVYGDGQLYAFFGARNAVQNKTDPTNEQLTEGTSTYKDNPNWMNESHAVWYLVDPKGNMVWNASYDWMNPVQYNHPAAIDVNGDGVLDFVALDWNTIGHKPGDWEPTNRSSNLFALDGRDGSVIWRTSVPIYWSNKDFVIADADGDGAPDIIVPEPKLGYDGLGVYSLATGKSKGWFPFVDGWGLSRGPVAGDLYGDGHVYLVVPAAKKRDAPNYRSLDVGYRAGELHIVATNQPWNVKFSANFVLSDEKDFTSHGSAGTPTVSLPAAPTGLTAKVDGKSVALSWSPPASNGGSPVTGYVVMRDGIRLANATGTSYSDSSATPGPHNYTVAAQNVKGAGPASDAARITLGGTVDPGGNRSTSPPGTTPSSSSPQESGTPAGKPVPDAGLALAVAVAGVVALARRRRR